MGTQYIFKKHIVYFEYILGACQQPIHMRLIF